MAARTETVRALRRARKKPNPEDDAFGRVAIDTSFEGSESHLDELLLPFGGIATLFAQNHKKRKRVWRVQSDPMDRASCFPG